MNIAVLVAAAGCGGAEEVPAGEFIQRAADIACEGDSACVDAWRQDAAGIDLSASARAGRISYDGGAAGRCLSSLRAADCRTLDMLNTLWPWQLADVPGCDTMISPRQGQNAPCASSVECIDGACFAAEGASATACHPLRGAGEPCPSWEACAPDLFCDGSGACAPQVPDGASCTADAQCAGEGACSQSVCQPPPSAC